METKIKTADEWERGFGLASRAGKDHAHGPDSNCAENRAADRGKNEAACQRPV